MKLKFPLRYYSFTTVPKEFTPKSSLPDGGSIELGEILADISSAPAEVSALTPYLFVLFETENGAASWQYLDLAGETKRIHFANEESYVTCEKVTFENGAYMYRLDEVYLKR